MPVLTRLIPSPVVVDIRPGALDDLACVLADQRISHSGYSRSPSAAARVPGCARAWSRACPAPPGTRSAAEPWTTPSGW